MKAAYQLQAAQRGVPATEPAMTAEEREAANLVVEQVAGAGGRGGDGGAGGARRRRAVAAGAGRRRTGARGRGGAVRRRRQLPAAQRRRRRQGGGGATAADGGNAGPSLPTEFNAEFSLLLGKHKTALEIRDFLSGEFTPRPAGGRHGRAARQRSGWGDPAGAESTVGDRLRSSRFRGSEVRDRRQRIATSEPRNLAR